MGANELDEVRVTEERRDSDRGLMILAARLREMGHFFFGWTITGYACYGVAGAHLLRVHYITA